MKKLHIGVLGLGFGASFAEIYAHHPDVEKVTVAELNAERLKSFTERIAGKENVSVCASFEEMLRDPNIDAVHVCSGIPAHAQQSVAVLNAGKHCACAVPMATSLEDIQAIVNAVRASGKNYMMMETNLFTAAFLTAKTMLENGEFGKVQHMRGIHYQPMEGGYWGKIPYWQGLPPMHYATHAVSPLRGIAGARIDKVVCFGSGGMAESLVRNYNNPYPVEDALLSFENGLKGEVARGLFECSAKPTESFNIYGSRKTLMTEYAAEIVEKVHDESQYDHAGFIVENRRWKNRYDLLPREIQRFTVDLPDGAENHWEEYLDSAPFSVHEGSHPHLCHEFVRSIVENRKSSVDEDVAANITAAGVCAHASAMRGGEVVEVPRF